MSWLNLNDDLKMLYDKLAKAFSEEGSAEAAREADSEAIELMYKLSLRLESHDRLEKENKKHLYEIARLEEENRILREEVMRLEEFEILYNDSDMWGGRIE